MSMDWLEILIGIILGSIIAACVAAFGWIPVAIGVIVGLILTQELPVLGKWSVLGWTLVIASACCSILLFL